MKKLIEDIRSDFDFVLLDCPAGSNKDSKMQ